MVSRVFCRLHLLEDVPSVLTVLNTAEAERNTEQQEQSFCFVFVGLFLPDDCESMKLEVAANKP